MAVHKTWNKKDLLDICESYQLPIEDARDLNKKNLSESILLLLKDNLKIDWSSHYPDIMDTEDMFELISNPKDNCELNYKGKQEMIQKAKYIIHYCRNGFLLGGSSFMSVEELYQEGLLVANHCDIPTCRRAIQELNQDLKIRTKIEIKVSTKVKKDLELKKINKRKLTNRFTIESGIYKISFD